LSTLPSVLLEKDKGEVGEGIDISRRERSEEMIKRLAMEDDLEQSHIKKPLLKRVNTRLPQMSNIPNRSTNLI